MVQKNLIAPKISLFDCDKNSVVDCDNWRLLPRAPQIKLNHRNVRAWKEVHEKGYPRAWKVIYRKKKKFHLEHRWLKEGKLYINDRYKVDMLIDPRIKRNAQVIDRSGWNDAGAILGRKHIEFYL